MAIEWKGATQALLRIVTGLLFLPHGYAKLFGLADMAPRHDPLPLVAGVIELVGGSLILLGLGTRWTAFLCSGLMAAAYFMSHGGRALLPLLNGGELAALYCFVFLFLWANGPGPYSLDSWLRNRSS